MSRKNKKMWRRLNRKFAKMMRRDGIDERTIKETIKFRNQMRHDLMHRLGGKRLNEESVQIAKESIMSTIETSWPYITAEPPTQHAIIIDNIVLD